MSRAVLGALPLLFLLSFIPPDSSLARTNGPAANGSFQVSMGNGQREDIEFEVRAANDGNVTGEITFRQTPTEAAAPKSTLDGEPVEAAPLFYAKAACDCLSVKGNEAVLSGTVTESSVKSYIGRKVLLVVQEGHSLTPPVRDKLTFGFYRNMAKGWVESDEERPEEQSPARNWVVTDAERPDDLGTLAQRSDEITCGSFPILSYSFLSEKQGKGRIQVIP
jgi:hypothetical protein